MGKEQATFGNATLAFKMASQFGAKKAIPIHMRYAKQAMSFIRKVEKAHKAAACSETVFG